MAMAVTGESAARKRAGHAARCTARQSVDEWAESHVGTCNSSCASWQASCQTARQPGSKGDSLQVRQASRQLSGQAHLQEGVNR
jgi:hypothetical protein